MDKGLIDHYIVNIYPVSDGSRSLCISITTPVKPIIEHGFIHCHFDDDGVDKREGFSLKEISRYTIITVMKE
ncbi:Uncharacterised protein [Klebsiella pneumoniae]|nr:Uncharacterised protein [Klebsiella pneumoniae]